MSLKEQVPNVYGVGARNVGSYLVAGVPHITTATVSSGGETNVSFQNLTKDIKITKNTTGGYLRVHFASKGAGHTPKALGFQDSDSDNVPDEILSIQPNLAQPYTFSVWYKSNIMSALGTNFALWRISGTPNACKIRYQGGGGVITQYMFTTTLRCSGVVRRKDVVVPISSYDQLGWHNYVISVGPSEYSVYIDGSDLGTLPLSTNGIPDPIGTINMPREFSGLLDTTHYTFWNKDLNSTEVSELYNNGNFFDPTTHTAAGNLSHWFRMDDTLSPPDTTTQIFDRVGNLTGSIILNPRPGSAQTQTSAQFVSAPAGWFSGSASTPNTITGGHYITLTDSSPSVTLRCSCKEVYLSATGGNQTATVMANLTSISSAGIPDLTGSGIDE